MARQKNTDLISGIMAKAADKRPSDASHIPLSIRPGDKISALLDIVAKLTSKSPAEFASDGLPESLFLYLVSSEARLEFAATQIKEILQKGEQLQEGSALALLVERGVIEVKS